MKVMIASAVLLSVAIVPVVRADVFGMPAGQKSLEMVNVGDPGNVASTFVTYPGRGDVAYVYKMGKYEVTAGQYCQFLNAVAKSDPYALYSPYMDPTVQSGPLGGNYSGCGIMRSGSDGSYVYSLDASRANLPVNYVSWLDAARFSNWLTNGQPAGAEGAGTTETGSYTLNGAITEAAAKAVARNAGATFAVPTEDEWYKAAYYKGGGTNAGYWAFPMNSDSTPSPTLSSTGTANAFFGSNVMASPRPLSVGFFAGSPGPYGTFDQGGNVNEWNDSLAGGNLLGGSWVTDQSWMLYRFQYPGVYRTGEVYDIGFRIVLVPEAGTLALVAIGGWGLIARRRRAK